ncbi:MAG: hypothetical protein U0228_10350 [Myxococcaceae bacterium]
MSEVDWRPGVSLQLGFVHASGRRSRLEVRFFAPEAPGPVARTSHLAIYVVGTADAGTPEETELLARALAAWLDEREADAGLPPLSPLGP